MELKHQTIDLLNDMDKHPMTHPFIISRKAENFKDLKKHNLAVRHPFDPTFLFDAGIVPIKEFNIKGVIWYQGESNADRVSFHSQLFKSLVKDWRLHWDKPEMPFYYVQLSSINRPTWGHFRDAQRRLLSIPNTAMAVSLDVGHPTNVHPTNKWIVGKRLALAALAKTYKKDIPYSGPLLDYVNVIRDTLEVHFHHKMGLATKDDGPVRDMEIAGSDKIFIKAQAKIVQDVLLVWSPKIKAPRFIKYGYTPYTNGNLINKHGLPASTFSNLSIEDAQ